MNKLENSRKKINGKGETEILRGKQIIFLSKLHYDRD